MLRLLNNIDNYQYYFFMIICYNNFTSEGFIYGENRFCNNLGRW